MACRRTRLSIRHRLLLLAAASVPLATACPAAAGPLEDALATAYLDNPRLAAGRAALRAAEEAVQIAGSAGMPSVGFASSVGVKAGNDGGAGSGGLAGTTRQSLSVTQRLYAGGETAAAVGRAEGQAGAERARLAQLEQQVLLETVALFTAVARDRAVLERARDNEKRLKAQLAATRDRLRFGDVSKTDVAQAEVRHAGAAAERVRAEGELATSAADYARVVGAPPGTLELPDAPADEAESLDAAIARAADAFPLQAARFELAAAEAGVAQARAGLRPRVALTGEVAYADDATGGAAGEGDHGGVAGSAGAQVAVTFRLPLYLGGAGQARLRQSRELRSERAASLDEAGRAAAAAVAAAWHAGRAAEARIRSLEAQADAAAFALEGVRQEALAGSRTVLDVLDAESELFRAEVELVRARRERVLAAYRLRAATGRMTAEALGLPAAAPGAAGVAPGEARQDPR